MGTGMILCVSRPICSQRGFNIGDLVFLAPLDGDLFEGFLLEPVPSLFNPENDEISGPAAS
jgi:hypothetical protein